MGGERENENIQEIILILQAEKGITQPGKRDNCHHEQHFGAQVKKHCMDVKMVKLSPSVSVHLVEFNVAPVFVGILPSNWMTLPRPVICCIQKSIFWNRNAPHSPPRAYLRSLNSLII